MRTHLLSLSSALLLAACGQITDTLPTPAANQTATPAASEPATSTTAEQTARKPDFTSYNSHPTVVRPGQTASPIPAVTTRSYDFFHQKCCYPGGKLCAEVRLTLPDTGIAWLNRFWRESFYNNQSTKEQTIKNDASLRRSYQNELNRLAAKVKTNDYGEVLYQSTSDVRFLYQRDNLAFFESSFDIYEGGAHGWSRLNYWIMDLKKHKLLELQDILLPGRENESEVLQLLQNSFDVYLEDNKMEAMSETERKLDKSYLYHASILFTANGLLFHYNDTVLPGHGYAQGQVDLTIDWISLNQFIKPEYRWK